MDADTRVDLWVFSFELASRFLMDFPDFVTVFFISMVAEGVSSFQVFKCCPHDDMPVYAYLY